MAPTTEQEFLDSLPDEERKNFMFDNDGHVVSNNRQNRRKKLPSDPKYTKATHSLQLARAKSKKAFRKTH